jgi:hypothetical protein
MFGQAGRHLGSPDYSVERLRLKELKRMHKHKTFVKEVILLNPGKWGIIMDFALEEKLLLGKELLVDYDETNDISESRDGCLMIETLEVPVVKRGDTIEITIRDRNRKKRSRGPNERRNIAR